MIGTPRYMSPEQCMGRPVGTASDLYSVGVLVYEMLSGQPPFTDQLQSAVLVRQATAAPPPLMARCPEAPRRLAMATHTLLAKNPGDRPQSAREARAMLERSIQNTAQLSMPEETAPFANTLATMNTRSSNGSRLIAAATILAMLGGLFFVWSNVNTTSARSKAGSAGARPAASSSSPAAQTVAARTDFVNDFEDESREATPATVIPASLSGDAARQIAATVSADGAVSEARVLRTVRGTSIAAVRDERQRSGMSHLFLLETRGASGGFRVAARAQLDKEGFSGARWTTEVSDTDADGYDEIICTGTDSRDDPFSRRLVLYVPRTRQSYSMRVGLDSRESKAIRVRWSSNAGGDKAKPYRAALRARALADLPQAKL
jgi:hypothetical protein